MTDDDLRRLRSRLLKWYQRSRRELPWRSPAGVPPDPYHVWLSETMLQQTRVDTVRPYYERWLNRFPTLESLAAADLDEVLKAWEGLGYYSRARNLHRAVREVAARYGGRVPDDPTALRSLPGVGRYTAGAVMSIAFDRPEPVVDGNVRRVLARLLDHPSPAEALLWEMAGRLVQGSRPGDLNQALMELGATICTPRSPRCEVCPIAEDCRARAAGTQHERPARRRRAPLPHEHRVAAVVMRDGAVLVGRSPEAGRLGGMWEFPGGNMLPDESVEDALRRVLPVATGFEAAPAGPLAVIDHTFTHVRVSYHAVRGEVVGGDGRVADYDELRWIAPADLDRLALPRAQRRIAAFAFPSRPQSTAVHG